MIGETRNFSDKTVIITGGGSGVGFECAKLFAKANANIFLIGRNTEKLRKASLELGEYGVNATYIAGDIAISNVTKDAVETALKRHGSVDILVNNAGAILRKTAEDTTDEDWARIMGVNVTGVFNASRAFAKAASVGGTIVNVSSTCGQVGAAGLAQSTDTYYGFGTCSKRYNSERRRSRGNKFTHAILKTSRPQNGRDSHRPQYSNHTNWQRR